MSKKSEKTKEPENISEQEMEKEYMLETAAF